MSLPLYDKSIPTSALVVKNLGVSYGAPRSAYPVLHNLCLSLDAGQAYGLVGESGSGKSTTALAIMRYLPRGARITHGRILIDGRDVLAMDAPSLRAVRVNAVSMIYQDPGRALNPALTIGRQLGEAFPAGLARGALKTHAAALLGQVRLADPARVLASYPHQLSGGMQQRVVIAMALASNPKLLILDEPTTGLDATVQGQILDLLARLRAERGMAMLFISHNLSVVARVCETLGVLYAGRLVEEGGVVA